MSEEQIEAVEVKPKSWNETINFLKINTKIWQLILVLVLSLGCFIVIGFTINSFLNYRVATNNDKLNEQLKSEKERGLELEKIVSESLGALKVKDEILKTETLKRQALEETFNLSEEQSNEKVKTYEETKRAITTDSNDYTTEQLCKRAEELGIICKSTK